MTTDAPLGTRIKRARERTRISGHYMTQQDLADALGVSRSAVNAWENNRAHPRSAIGALEQVLGVNLADTPRVEQFTPDERELLDLLERSGVPEGQRLQMLEQYRSGRGQRAAG